jgi:hypothetical protein
MFIYIHIFSYYKLLLYFIMCLSVMLDTQGLGASEKKKKKNTI